MRHFWIRNVEAPLDLVALVFDHLALPGIDLVAKARANDEELRSWSVPVAGWSWRCCNDSLSVVIGEVIVSDALLSSSYRLEQGVDFLKHAFIIHDSAAVDPGGEKFVDGCVALHGCDQLQLRDGTVAIGIYEIEDLLHLRPSWSLCYVGLSHIFHEGVEVDAVFSSRDFLEERMKGIEGGLVAEEGLPVHSQELSNVFVARHGSDKLQL
mmetsp:Transcript_96291/g.171055  ORF Transcript_96291/g.171055 Transcript_96291/m.171055 type:complete len:210 (-) Transcript_96291:367-996(-)